jgi:cytochrome c556
MQNTSWRLRRGAALGAASIALAAAIIAANAQSASPGAAAGPSPSKQAVENRRAIYTLIGNYFRYIGGVAKGAVGYDEAEVTKRATRIAFLSSLADENFPDGSNVGEPDSKAKADIWADRADFDKKLKEFQVHAKALAEVSEKEKASTDAFKAAVAALGQDCKGCHDTFKVK